MKNRNEPKCLDHNKHGHKYGQWQRHKAWTRAPPQIDSCTQELFTLEKIDKIHVHTDGNGLCGQSRCAKLCTSFRLQINHKHRTNNVTHEIKTQAILFVWSSSFCDQRLLFSLSWYYSPQINRKSKLPAKQIHRKQFQIHWSSSQYHFFLIKF